MFALNMQRCQKCVSYQTQIKGRVVKFYDEN